MAKKQQKRSTKKSRGSKRKSKLLVSLTDGVTVAEATKMQSYVERYGGKAFPPRLPDAWVQPDKQLYFNAVAGAVLGEDPATKWLQHEVFAQFCCEEPQSSRRSGISLTNKNNQLVVDFLCEYPTFLDNMIAEIQSFWRLHEDTANELIVEALYQSLGSPTGRCLDQRRNFFIRHPQHMPVRARRILEKRNIVFDRSKTSDEQSELWCDTDGKHGKIAFEMLAGNLKARHIALRLWDSVVGQLEAILASLIKSTDLRDHICALCHSRAKNHHRKEMAHRKRVHDGRAVGTLNFMESIGGDMDDADFSSVMPAYTVRPLSADEHEAAGLDDDDIGLVQVDHLHRRHTGVREDSDQERMNKAVAATDAASAWFKRIEQVANTIVDGLHADREKLLEGIRSDVAAGKKISDSKRLEVILPNVLTLFLHAAKRGIFKVISPEQEVDTAKILKGFSFVWKEGRSAFRIGGDGAIEVSVSVHDVDEEMKRFAEHELCAVRGMYAAYRRKDKSAIDIANETGVDLPIVRSLIDAIEVWEICPTRRRYIKRTTTGKATVKVEAFDDFAEYFSNASPMRAASLKSYFAHRWTKMMPYLFGLTDPQRPYDPQTNPRKFHTFEAPQAIADLFDLLTVHQYIKDGTIMRTVEIEYITLDMLSAERAKKLLNKKRVIEQRGKVYAIDAKGNKLEQPRRPYAIGRAWGWSENRLLADREGVRITYTEMYWAMMGCDYEELDGVINVSLPPHVRANKDRIDKMRQENDVLMA